MIRFKIYTYEFKPWGQAFESYIPGQPKDEKKLA